MKYAYTLLVLLMALFLAAFIQQNGTGIELKYFQWSTPHLPLSLYMILSFVAGYVLAVLVGFSTGIRVRFRASSAQRQVRQLRSELEQIKGEQADVPVAAGSGDAGPTAEEGTEEEEEATEGAGVKNSGPGAETVVIGSGGEEK